MDDIRTVMWKEWRSMFRAPGRRSQALLGLLSPVMLAVAMPIMDGEGWLREVPSLLVAFVVALLIVGMTVPDSFAGERERHTLPTLLASRLPDRAILIGKLAGPVLLGLGMTVFLLVIGLVVANVANWEGHLLMYSPTVLLADLLLSSVVCLLTGSLGVLFSLRARTAQEAQQSTMGVLLVLPIVLQFALFILLGSASGKAWLQATLGRIRGEYLLLAVVALLAVLDAVLIRAAMARFQRARLILSD
jgi:ABC-2 type transport system permease protein